LYCAHCTSHKHAWGCKFSTKVRTLLLVHILAASAVQIN
jgi:hypothetical protein